MIVQIWRVLAQVLFNNNDSADVLKPFLKNLRNENINNDKYIPLLKTFSNSQLQVLYQNEIISEERFHSLTINSKKQDPGAIKLEEFGDNNCIIDKIISNDNIKELQALLLEKDFEKDIEKYIVKPFKEAELMIVPHLHYCIMKNAIKCFKYLLVNGYDDPNRIMYELNPIHFYINIRVSSVIKTVKRYEWDSMTTAIYLGKKAMIKILEERGIEKGSNPTHLEAAILSYRNEIAKEIIDEIIETNQKEYDINVALLASGKSNNITGAKLSAINARSQAIILEKRNFKSIMEIQ